MFSKNFQFLFFIGSLYFLSSCDETTAPINKLDDSPIVNSLTLSTNVVQFTADDDFKDTTFVLTIEAIIENVDSESSVGYTIRDKQSLNILSLGNLVQFENSFSKDVIFNTTTTTFATYLIEVFAYNETGNGNYYQAPFTIIGISNDPPIILEVNNPENVTIPSSGDIVIPFTAKVYDPDGQENIDRVMIEFINEDGSSLIPTPNLLLDNGLNEDVAAGDSVYTIVFTINSQNTPNNRKAIYFAVDKAGLHSDTLQTTFNIVEQ